MTLPLTESTGCFTALSKQTGEELKLAMQRLWLTGKVTPFGARLLVEHTFESDEAGAVEVVYAFMLPQDAALRSFRIEGEGFEVVSDLQPVDQAVETYEQGIDDGSLAVLARQYVDGMVNLTVGNLQPGERVRVILEILAGVERHDDGFRFRFPFTLAPSYHPEMKSIAVPGGGELELPRERFGDLILPAWKNEAEGLHSVGFDLEVLGGQGLASVTSPSHAVSIAGEGAERRIGMAVAAELPNRDLVLEVNPKDPWNIAWTADGSISALVASSHFGEPEEEHPRRVVFVVDRSGSMQGRPIEQARLAIEAGIAALRPQDQFSIVAFDHRTESLSRTLLAANDKNRIRARSFLQSIHARGGTELAAGLEKAANIVRKGGGDLLLLTDGQVFGTAEILQTARQAGARIHALGIGSASQDRFLSQLGRDTGGRSRFLTARERVDLGLLDLFATISPPVAVGVRVQAGDAILATRDVFPGQPLNVRGEGMGPELAIAWAGRSIDLPVPEAPRDLAESLRLLQGAAEITEIESRLGAESEGESRQALESLGRQYGLASRAMALVAVVRRDSDKAGELPRTQVVPVGMPQDVDPNAYFAMHSLGVGASLLDEAAPMIMRRIAPPGMVGADRGRGSRLRDLLTFSRRKVSTPDFPMQGMIPPTLEDEEDRLVEEASQLEADGGMPGSSVEQRVSASLDLLDRLLEAGSTRVRGPFRHHVRRLLEFLEDAELDESQRERLAELEARAES